MAQTVDGEEPVGARKPVESNDHRQVVLIESSDVSSVEEWMPPSETRVCFQCSDAAGKIHLVQGIQNVPAAFRFSARNHSETSRVTILPTETATRARRYESAVAVPGFNPNRLDVTLSSAQWCGACRRVKRLLDDENVRYREHDIDTDKEAQEQLRSVLGNIRTPLLDIDGTYIAGFHPKAILDHVRGG